MRRYTKGPEFYAVLMAYPAVLSALAVFVTVPGSLWHSGLALLFALSQGKR